MIVTSYTTGSVHYLKRWAGSRSTLVNVSKVSSRERLWNMMIIFWGGGYGRHEVWKRGWVWPTRGIKHFRPHVCQTRIHLHKRMATEIMSSLTVVPISTDFCQMNCEDVM